MYYEYDLKNTPKSSDTEPLYYPSVSQDAAIEGSCIFNSLFHIWESETLIPLELKNVNISATGKPNILNKVNFSYCSSEIS